MTHSSAICRSAAASKSTGDFVLPFFQACCYNVYRIGWIKFFFTSLSLFSFSKIERFISENKNKTPSMARRKLSRIVYLRVCAHKLYAIISDF